MSKVTLLIVDRVNANSPSTKVDLTGSEYDKFDILDIKLEYFKSNRDKIDNKLLTEDELKLVNSTPLDYKFEFDPDTKYLALGKDTFFYISNMIHLGPRSEGFYDVSKMDYLRTREGIIFKFIYVNYSRETKWLTKEQFDTFNSNLDKIKLKLKDPELISGVSKKNGRAYYMMKYKTIAPPNKDVSDFINRSDFPCNPSIKYSIVRDKFNEAFDKLIFEYNDGKWFGLDYETSGFPFDDPDFYHMGVSIVTNDGFGYYFDMDWIQRNNLFEEFKSKYKEFLDLASEVTVTYNQSFEMRATYLLFNKLYFFNEASTINKLDGLVYKNFSLKYTAMKNLNVSSWDNDFDYLNIVLSRMFDNYTIDNFEESSEWKDISDKYPNDLDEFKLLFKLAYGNSFRCIPANILGKYCCLDSYYTVLLRDVAVDRYKDPRAWTCYNNNLTLGALLGIQGCTIDTNELSYMKDTCLDLLTYGMLTNALTYSKFKLSFFDGLEVPEIPNYIKNCLLKGLNPLDSKSILYNCVDESDKYYINRNKIKDYFSEDVLDEVIITIESYGGLNGIWRSRNIFKDINALSSNVLQIDTVDDNCILSIDGNRIDLGLTFDDLVEYYRINGEIDQVIKFLENRRLGESYLLDNKIVTQWDVIDYCKGIVNVMSTGHDDIKQSLFENYKYMMYGLFPTKEFTLQSFDTKFEKEKLIELPNPNNDFYIESLNEVIKAENLANKLINNLTILNELKSKNIKTKNMSGCLFLGYIVKSDYAVIKSEFDKKLTTCDSSLIGIAKSDWLSEDNKLIDQPNEIDKVINLKRLIRKTYDSYCENFKKVILSGNYYQAYKELSIDGYNDLLMEYFNDYRKLGNNFVSYQLVTGLCVASKKYYKILTTYVEGQFTAYNRGTNGDDSNLISTERYHNLNECSKIKMYSPFNVCEKKSKRWSASMHTVPSKSEVKRILGTPKGYLLSYFDISGAEVRAISYISKDEYMLDCYNKKMDPYITLAKFIDPGKDEDYYKDIRYIYKILLLGAMYGMGIPMMAEKAGISKEDAASKYKEMFTRMCGIKRLAEEKGKYCVEHHGRIESFLGDVLEMGEGDEDRYLRLGINQFIQNIGACSLADAFFNIIKHAYEENRHIHPINVVHDSSQNYVKIDNLFDLYEFYHHHLTDYCKEKYGIVYEFDLEIGSNYFDMCKMSSIDENTIKLKGDYFAIKGLLDKLNNESDLKFKLIKATKNGNECKITGNTFEDLVPDKFIHPFILFFNTCFDIASFKKDSNKYVIEIQKLN